MPSRLLALLLALALLWSGASSHESVVLAWSGDEVVERVVKPALATPGSGSLDEHHLDDLTSQAHGDVQVDLSALPSAAFPSACPHVAAGVPAAAPPSRLTSPYLDGLHRPPDASPVA